MNRKHHIILCTAGLLVCGLVFLLLLKLDIVDYECPFRLITRLNCPGCGNTRATLALLRLDLKGMLKSNLLYPLEILYALWIYFMTCRNYLREGRVYYGTRWIKMDIVILIILAFWTVFRNAVPFFYN